MANNVPCIRYAVAATASCHIGNRLQDKSLNIQSLHLRLNATEALRRQLRDDVEKTDISSLACMVLLAQLDVRTWVSMMLQTWSNVRNSSAPGTASSLVRI